MNDVHVVEIFQSLHRLVQRVLAEALRIVSLQIFQHRCEGPTLHQLKEDPQSVLEIKCLMALNNRLTVAKLHDAYFIDDRIALGRTLWLSELKSKHFSVRDPLTLEHSRESADTNFANNFVVTGGIVFLNFSCIRDEHVGLVARFQLLFRVVSLLQDNVQAGGWILLNFLLVEGHELSLDCLGQPFKPDALVLVDHRHRDLLHGLVAGVFQEILIGSCFNAHIAFEVDDLGSRSRVWLWAWARLFLLL